LLRASNRKDIQDVTDIYRRNAARNYGSAILADFAAAVSVAATKAATKSPAADPPPILSPIEREAKALASLGYSTATAHALARSPTGAALLARREIGRMAGRR
jgi:hypothetical protein